MTRDKRTIKFTKPIVSNKEGLQLATPEIVAEYIAQRLKTDIIADLGCGIGGQVIFFARKCRKVYAVDKDPEKLQYAKENCELYGVDNVEFILGDALSQQVKEKVSDADIIFSDPARPLSEKERTLETLKPPITEIIRVYSGIIPDLAFHAPPQMPPERLKLDCEREYLSLNGQLNRLTLYMGSLKCCDRSAVVLPGGEKLCLSGPSQIRERSLCEYVYEPEPSVVKAGLLDELAGTLDQVQKEVFLFKKEVRRTLLTSHTLIQSPFFKATLRVVARTDMDLVKLKGILISEKAKNVVLRLDIDPGKYWDMRKTLEEGLEGTRTLHVFGFGNELIVCEKV
jgi:SAM-dependent methyltransferase